MSRDNMKGNLVTSILLAVTFCHSQISTTSVSNCPEIFDPNHLVFLPHADCTKFYLCGHNDPVEKQCPPGLHWNSHASVCDWPSFAGCEYVSAVPSTPEAVTTTEAPPAATSAPSSTVSPTGKCPEVFDPDHTAFLPHDDCSKFYICTLEGPIEHNCPAGLQWNQQGGVCDWPEVARCVNSNEGRETVGECPELYDPENEVFLPHASSCSKYYLCTWGGVPVVQNCPAGLHWNKNTNQCDWPAQAGCSLFDRDIHFRRSRLVVY